MSHIEVDSKEADQFLKKLADLISATSCFPRLKGELMLLQGIEEDAKILLRKDVSIELGKLILKF